MTKKKSYSVDLYGADGDNETLKDFSTHAQAYAFVKLNLKKYKRLVINHWDNNLDSIDYDETYEYRS